MPKRKPIAREPWSQRRARDRKGITLVTQEEAEQAEFVACCTRDMPSFFSDDVTTTCALCGVGIFHRPHVPKRPPKVCLDCALKLVTAKRD